MITGEATWVRDLWRDHDAALRELISTLQVMRSNQGRSMREFSAVRLLSSYKAACHFRHSTDLLALRVCVSHEQHLHIRLNFNEFFPEQQED